ncbi:hypothetical protein B566_EDAN001842, partial [Ephemera danica]
MFHRHTCVRFRPRVTSRDEDYVSIESFKAGCYSAVGRIGGRQILNLQARGCTALIGIPIHELMHVIGFHHEHSRSDRDTYVKIHWNNIERVLKQGVTLLWDVSIGIPIHELMHVIGFHHEHSRSDRDTYVKIHWNNIERGDEHNFDKELGTSAFRIPYDYGSIMHYARDDFSKNGKDTITPK